MIDMLVFLKHDYTEPELQKMINEVAAYMEFLGADGVALLKTTENTVFRGSPPNMSNVR